MFILPNDLVINYNFKSGTIAPPYRYEYTFSIDAKGNGIIKYKPDFVFDTVWTKTFKLQHKNMRKFWILLKKNDFFTREWAESQKKSVGGSIKFLEVTANGKSYKIPAFPSDTDLDNANKILEATQKLIPQAIMDSLSAKREKCIEKFQKEKK
jgi:hypothetical protein